MAGVRMSTLSKGIELSQKSIEQFGFVVVAFDGPVPIGHRTERLWKEYEMPQTFVVVRLATDEEWEAQIQLGEQIFGRPRRRDSSGFVKYVLMTD